MKITWKGYEYWIPEKLRPIFDRHIEGLSPTIFDVPDLLKYITVLLKAQDEINARAVRNEHEAQKEIAELKKSLINIFEVFTCPDCDGNGSLGISSVSGKTISCERCYGDEDSLGRGLIATIFDSENDEQANLLQEALDNASFFLNKS